MAKAASRSEFSSLVRGGQWLLGTVMGVIIVGLILVFVIWRSWETQLVSWGVALVVLVPLALLTRWRTQLTLRIGDDGVGLAHGGARKFFPIETLASCSVVEVFEIAEGLDLVLRDGRSEKIAFPSLGGDDSGPAEPARGACEAIEASIARFRALERSGHARADLRLARHRETTLQWVTSLRRTEQVPASYRSGVPSSDDVLAVLDDPAAPSAMRVAAAIAIEGTPAQREHVRVAAERTADPKLAAALRSVVVSGSIWGVAAKFYPMTVTPVPPRPKPSIPLQRRMGNLWAAALDVARSSALSGFT